MPQTDLARVTSQPECDRLGMPRTMEEWRAHVAPFVPAGTSPGDALAFARLCSHYGLDPVLRQVYPMRDRLGRLVPVVGVDGWARLAREHPDCEGWTFAERRADDGALVAITCIMRVRGWTEPMEVTEYLSECRRDTPPWAAAPARMLRHKSLIQAARYAFGLGGIADEDDADARAGHRAAPAREARSASDINRELRLGIESDLEAAAPPAAATTDTTATAAGHASPAAAPQGAEGSPGTAPSAPPAGQPRRASTTRRTA